MVCLCYRACDMVALCFFLLFIYLTLILRGWKVA